MENAAKNFLILLSKRSSKNSGTVTTFDLKYTGAKNQPKKIKVKIAISSNWPTANPLNEPAPANPMKCSLEMFVAKIEIPTAAQPMFLPARK